MAGQGRLVAGPPDDEATHAVAHEDDLARLDRHGRGERVQHRIEQRAVLGHGEAAVVAHRERCEAEVGREERAVGARRVVREGPAGLVHAESVHEHREAVRRLGVRVRQRLALAGERLAPAGEGHGDGEAVAAPLEVVADDGVEHAQAPVELPAHAHPDCSLCRFIASPMVARGVCPGKRARARQIPAGGAPRPAHPVPTFPA